MYGYLSQFKKLFVLIFGLLLISCGGNIDCSNQVSSYEYGRSLGEIRGNITDEEIRYSVKKTFGGDDQTSLSGVSPIDSVIEEVIDATSKRMNVKEADLILDLMEMPVGYVACVRQGIDDYIKSVPSPFSTMDANSADNSLVKSNSISIMDLLFQGGIAGTLIISILFILSIITIYLFFERLFTIKKALKKENHFFNSIKDFLHDDKHIAAIDLCKNSDTPIARMLEKGIVRMNKSLKDISTTINNVGKLELSKLENNLAILATISGAAPMIGFLGTVIGMVLAFYEMASSGGQIDIEMLSKGIYTAMTTTIAGLIVGIVAYISYNYLVAKIAKAVYEMESTTIEFLDLIYDKKNN